MLSGPERFAREIAALASAFARAADILLRLLLRVLDSFRAETPQSPDAAMREAESGVSEVVEGLKRLASEWVDRYGPALYITGHREAGGDAESPDDLTREQRASLNVRMVELTSRLLSASDAMREDSLGKLRNIALLRLEAVIRGEQGIGRAGEEFRREVEEDGITLRDRLGRKLKPGPYAEGVLRATSGTLLNSGHVDTAVLLGSPGVRIFDNEGENSCQACKIANNQIWTLEFAAANLIEHVNCVRSMSALPSSWSGEFDRGD